MSRKPVMDRACLNPDCVLRGQAARGNTQTPVTSTQSNNFLAQAAIIRDSASRRP